MDPQERRTQPQDDNSHDFRFKHVVHDRRHRRRRVVVDDFQTVRHFLTL